MVTYAIEFEDVWFSYERSTVLQEVSFSLEQGEFLGIIGPNGGGKTTLLKLMLGILKPDRGQIRILGQPPHDASHRVGYVPQGTDFNRSFPVSVLDVALMGRMSTSRIGRRYSREDREKVRDVLEKVGMWGYRNRPIGKLSGGQRQRAALARALLRDTPVLIMDDTLSNLDNVTQEEILSSLNASSNPSSADQPVRLTSTGCPPMHPWKASK